MQETSPILPLGRWGDWAWVSFNWIPAYLILVWEKTKGLNKIIYQFKFEVSTNLHFSQIISEIQKMDSLLGPEQLFRWTCAGSGLQSCCALTPLCLGLSVENSIYFQFKRTSIIIIYLFIIDLVNEWVLDRKGSSIVLQC